MQLCKHFNVAIKLSLVALFLTGVTLFSFMRSDPSHAVAASHSVTNANVSSTCGSWSVVASPNFETHPNYLGSVAAVSASDVWAVGLYTLHGGSPRTLIEHWNGKNWSITPRPALAESSLGGVAALASNDVWAVGTILNSSYQTLIEHWNGTSWSVVPSPNTLAEDFFGSIAAVSTNDIWATGYAEDTTGIDHTLFEHWDGTQWSIVASPDAGSNNNFLRHIAAISSNDVWVVGSYQASPGATYQTLVEHWDGTQWSIIASPNVGTFGSGLSGVSVVSANNIWAVGSYAIDGVGTSQTLVEHWNGTKWSVVSSPNVGSSSNQLAAIAAIAAHNIWALGYSTSGSPPNPTTQTLIEHWDGTQWSVTPSPSPGNLNNFLNGVTRVPGTIKVWAVGSILSATLGAQTLTEFYC